jgi:NADH-quinone oxidoreductase subunit E
MCAALRHETQFAPQSGKESLPRRAWEREVSMIAAQRILTDEMVEEITALFPRYPTKQAVTLPALHIVNERLRYVPHQAVVEVAELLELAPAEVQDTLSFYGIFKQEIPHGRVRAWVCRSISCALRGGEEVLEHLCRHAAIRPGETTSDGKLTIEFAECIGACEFAPCMLANKTLHKDLTKEKAEGFLKEVRSMNDE